MDVNFVLRDTKASGGDIRIMAWSPEKDLLAAAIADNSVSSNLLMNTEMLVLSLIALYCKGYPQPTVVAAYLDRCTSG